MSSFNPFQHRDSTSTARARETDLSHLGASIGNLPGAPTDNSARKASNDLLVKQNYLPNAKISFGDAPTPVAEGHNSRAGGSSEQIPLSDQLMAAAMGIGIKANKDGSFDVKSPLDQEPVTAAGKIGQLIMSELLGGGDVPSGIPGLNSLLAASWKGWDMPAPVAEPEPEAPAPALADPNVSW